KEAREANPQRSSADIQLERDPLAAIAVSTVPVVLEGRASKTPRVSEGEPPARTRPSPSGETSAHPPNGEREQGDCESAEERRLDALEEPEAAGRLQDIGVEEAVGAHAVVEARLGARLGRSADAADGELGDGVPAGEREDVVGKRDEAVLVEDGGREAIAGRAVERPQPPADQERVGDRQGQGQRQERCELRGEPAQPGNALCPDEEVRALLELAADQWRAPEEAEQRRQHHEEGHQLAQGREAALESGLEVAAVRMPAGEAVAEARVLKDRVHVQPGQQQEESEGGKGRGPEQRWL